MTFRKGGGGERVGEGFSLSAKGYSCVSLSSKTLSFSVV